jgi:magnesium chelatase family protein
MPTDLDSAVQAPTSLRISNRAAVEPRGLAKILSCSIIGIDAVPVEVTVEVTPGDFAYHVVGLSARSAKQGGERVRAALKTLQQASPLANISVRLTPVELTKHGCGFDLPIVLGMLADDPRFSLEPLNDVVVLGELGLDGALRPVKGALLAALLTRSKGWRGVLVPHANAQEALAVVGIEVYSASHITEIVDALQQEHRRLPLAQPQRPSARSLDIDMLDARGHGEAHAALEISAAGGHHLLMVGGPGNTQTMLARRISTILPPMTRSESLETMKAYSAIGLVNSGLFVERPFRTPHFSISAAALLGGGVLPRPGEISLAHNGVLFLEHLHEFPRGAIDSLKGPLEQRTFTLLRGTNRVEMPASFQLIASTTPCPCGWLDSGSRECTCSTQLTNRHWKKISGPLLDRFDLQVFMRTRESRDRLLAPLEPSEVVRVRVEGAQARQQKRLEPWGFRRNAEMNTEALKATCPLDTSGEAILARLAKAGRKLTQQRTHRLLRVARTIADLRERVAIDDACLIDASAFVTSCVPIEMRRSASGKRC